MFTIECARNVTLLVVMIFATVALGQEGYPNAKPPWAPVPDRAIYGYGDVEKTCVSWNDSCTTCIRAYRSLRCSNIGIACQPNEFQCTARMHTYADPITYLLVIVAALAKVSFWGNALLWVTGYLAGLL
jgi:hypothetical protein